MNIRGWLRLPSRIALILGMGALSTTTARAEAPEHGDPSPFGDVLIRTEGGRIFLLEGGPENELRLSPSPERDRLLRLLEEHGPAGVKLDRDPRLIMSSGGGSGFYWGGTRKPVLDKPPPPLQNAPQAPVQRGLDPGANPDTAPHDNYTRNDPRG
jgi:hypothetical protein